MKSLKHFCITTLSTVTGKSVVNFFGSTYIVSGNVVRKFG